VIYFGDFSKELQKIFLKYFFDDSAKKKNSNFRRPSKTMKNTTILTRYADTRDIEILSLF
jgi:hypothetical protein